VPLFSKQLPSAILDFKKMKILTADGVRSPVCVSVVEIIQVVVQKTVAVVFGSPCC